MPMGSSGPGADAYERPVGLKKTTTQTNMKLGFYSEYKPGEAANGRTLGSYGYTSPTYTELRPAVPAARSPGKLSSGTATGPGPKALRGGRSLLTERDVDLLRERDADNQQVFEVWSQRKQLEQQLSHEERERCGLRGTMSSLITRHNTSYHRCCRLQNQAAPAARLGCTVHGHPEPHNSTPHATSTRPTHIAP